MARHNFEVCANNDAGLKNLKESLIKFQPSNEHLKDIDNLTVGNTLDLYNIYNTSGEIIAYDFEYEYSGESFIKLDYAESTIESSNGDLNLSKVKSDIKNLSLDKNNTREMINNLFNEKSYITGIFKQYQNIIVAFIESELQRHGTLRYLDLKDVVMDIFNSKKDDFNVIIAIFVI